MDMDNFVNGFGMALKLTEKRDTADLATVLCQARPFDSNQICDYEVLSPDEIVEHLVKFVQEINGIVELNTTITRMLLSHCKWDKDIMLEKFFDNADKLYREAHVINPASVNSVASHADDKECGICFSELSPIISAQITCGHQFCTSCWSDYLKVKIMDDAVGNSIACAASDCGMIIDDERVIQLVGDEKAKIRYQQLITNSFVQQNELLRWCPAVGCSFVIKAAYIPPNPICCYCKCGYEFCFDCSKEYHAPVNCALLALYETHAQLGHFGSFSNPDAQSRPRFSYDEKVKICPNLNFQVQLQKDVGCTVVKCMNCDSFFCWVCLNRSDSKVDAYRHRCKKAFRNDENKEPVETMTDAPVTSTNLRTNAYLDTNKEPTVEMAELTKFECASLEWIRTCRTLKYAVVFAIYAVDTTELTLLQNLVQNLEVAAAKLGRFISPISGPFPIGSEDLYDNITRNVLPAYADCQLRRRALLDYVNEGFSKEWWTFKAEH